MLQHVRGSPWLLGISSSLERQSEQRFLQVDDDAIINKAGLAQSYDLFRFFSHKSQQNSLCFDSKMKALVRAIDVCDKLIVMIVSKLAVDRDHENQWQKILEHNPAMFNARQTRKTRHDEKKKKRKNKKKRSVIAASIRAFGIGVASIVDDLAKSTDLVATAVIGRPSSLDMRRNGNGGVSGDDDSFRSNSRKALEDSTLFSAIKDVHASWKQQAVSYFSCQASLTADTLKALKKIRVDMIQQRSELRHLKDVAVSKMRRVEHRLERARGEVETTQRNLSAIDGGNRRLVQVASRKYVAACSMLQAAQEAYDYACRDYGELASKAMQLFDEAEGHRSSFLRSMRQTSQFWQDRLTKKLEELNASAHSAVDSIEPVQDVQHFISSNKTGQAPPWLHN